VQAFIFLGVGFLCALIGRALIITAAFRVSVWWGIGVLVPFGPLFFRLSYPDDVQRARKFQLAAIPCYFFYGLLGPGPGLARTPQAYLQSAWAKPSPTATATGYGLERLPTVPAKIEERRAANARELERLRLNAEALKLRKRDLLRSDVEGNRAYTHDLAEYNTAFAKANAEKTALGPLTK
jgi:hypothetical protein